MVSEAVAQPAAAPACPGGLGQGTGHESFPSREADLFRKQALATPHLWSVQV